MILVLAAMTASGLFAMMPLAENGKAMCPVVVPDQAVPAELKAAQTLTEYLKKITGAEFQIKKESTVPAGSKSVHVGRTVLAEKTLPELKNVQQEEWIIHTADGTLFLTGGKLRGIGYAVFEYLEQHCKVRRFTEEVETVPENASLRSGTLKLRGKPYLGTRWVFDRMETIAFSASFKEWNKGFSNTQPHNGMHKLLGGKRPHHTFIDYSISWPKDQPELYTRTAEGKVLIPKNGVGPGQICMTSPEARKRVLSQLKAFIIHDRKEAAEKGYPAPVIYDISQNDNNDFCVCASCKAIKDREGSFSGPLLDFINYIAREIRKEYPEIMIRTFAYQYTVQPPKNMKAEDNVLIHIAMLGAEFGGEYYPYDSLRSLDHPLNKESAELIRKWSRHAKNLAWWDYGILYPSIPEPFVRINAVLFDLPFFAKNNGSHFFIEFEDLPFHSFAMLERWLCYKLSDKPFADGKALVKEFMSAYYGKGAPAMTELLEYMEKRQNACPYRIGFVDYNLRSYLDDAYFKTVFALLKKAVSAAGDDTAAVERINRERIPLIAGLLMRMPYLNSAKEYNAAELKKEFRTLAEKEAVRFYIGGLKKTADRIIREAEKRFDTALSMSKQPANIVELNAFHAGKTKYSKIVADPDSYNGSAIVIPLKDNEKPIFTTSNWMESGYQTTAALDIPVDGKYHWIDGGTIGFINNGRYQIWFHGKEGILFGLYRKVLPDTMGTFRISAKRLNNQLYIDRVLVTIRKMDSNFVLPKEFAGKKVSILRWNKFRAAGKYAAVVKDPAATGGSAMSNTAPTKTKNKMTYFGVYDPDVKKSVVSVRVASASIKDENYHWIKIGTLKVGAKMYFYAGNNWASQCLLRDWNGKEGVLYASVKFTGKEYVPGSVNPNAILVDGLILVEK